ncbi:hydrogenase assembly chaperone HoxL (HypC/HupF family) [Azotobacter vinelandii CA]|uniref:Hydrogenase expression/formation protein HoxL n=2 Tax=Azotobacter vinelandii TaxID=354 RepID=HOXL_AZOVI|nr:HypC/HybG/HupF family hydrogenase formation chaperone [Azotobacter vinelandii]P40592.1 RecName: Full=Hydrogenase expression/formation protein HoxL [Azotobacter vinelandii]AAA19502.1 hoxL [Azotobacter vinelandii]AAA22127.1 hoxL [Azotobacter vinelandii]ACO81143.1 hydrogenase assembly chaperone HoxL (HypC/HupF family) [Azotobacter vinelandii DJ]AGK13591.1 hydrogenase assembly chaperone HoxL (HypC/HupF family) [Azotobacter vinelandii CA]SFX92540.1 hydrogenase expression/formation protein HypC 
MCIGIPLRVLECAPGRALCGDENGVRWIDTRLVEPPAPGDWLLVFLDAAREILDAGRAARIREALRALQAVQAGDPAALAGLFADLDREPQLPPHLQAQLPPKEPT